MGATFSIAIPNFNYGKYIGATIQSVLDQREPAAEIYVSDNASTDDTVRVLEAIDDPVLRWHRNRRNVGFAGNIDRAVMPTTGTHVIVLSSDDLMLPDALATYRKLLDHLGDDGQRVCALEHRHHD